MKLGVFNSMFKKYSAAETAQKMRKLGFTSVQLALGFGGEDLTSAELDREKCEEIKAAFAENGIEISALCGYTSLATPHLEEREAGILELKALIECCPALGCQYIVTEAGSANPQHNWTYHPDNEKPELWAELTQTLKDLCTYAQGYGVSICIEPHFGQMARSPKTLKKMLDGVMAPNLKLACDPANLITPDNAAKADEMLEELFALVGSSIALLHVKDTLIKEGKSVFVPAGKGVLNYPLYAQLAKKQGYQGPVILEYVNEAGLPEAMATVKEAFGI